MANIKEKKIGKGKYYYISRSVRLPNGKVATIEKSIGRKKRPVKEVEEEFSGFLLEKEKDLFSKFALKSYGQDSVFTEEQIKKIEGMEVEYNHLVKKFSKGQWKDAFDRFIANFTYESNAIEGNSLTLRDVAIVMFDKMSIEGKDLREIYETRNSRKVMDLMLKKKFDVCEEDIIKIHKMLMKDIDIRTGYKIIPNYILGSDVKLTPPEKVESEMRELMEWHNESIGKIHPLKLSALFHGEFERIHPFEDGNGRVGRFISNIILINNNYPPLIIRKSQRKA